MEQRRTGTELAAPSRFESILSHARTPAGDESHDPPSCFRDLNLDQIVEAITSGLDHYDLRPFFYAPLTSVDAVGYRHEVMRDLDDPPVTAGVTAFTEGMRRMREQRAQSDKLRFARQKERWFLDAVATYCRAVRDLDAALSRLDVHSRGLRALRAFVGGLVDSDAFGELCDETAALTADLDAVRYCVIVKGTGLRVRRYDGEPDYSAEVLETFAKFRQGEVKDYRVGYRAVPEMNHIEEIILDFVARLYPQEFAHLAEFCSRRRDFTDPVLVRFDREIHFYLGYQRHIDGLRRVGLRFSYPQVSDSDKTLHVEGAFDLALAAKLAATNVAVVRNDMTLSGQERILVVSGPNQGGKTTFARAFGQLHYLASIGLPVPAARARLFLSDSILTHFEREEHIDNLRGKLQDDLVRIHDILTRATPRTVVIINEIFTSTTLTDATVLTRRVLERIIELDLLCVCVTFLDELSRLGVQTVSMVSTVMPDDPTVRTFEIERRPADGRSYAISIAEKYGLTYERVKARIPVR